MVALILNASAKATDLGGCWGLKSLILCVFLIIGLDGVFGRCDGARESVLSDVVVERFIRMFDIDAVKSSIVFLSAAETSPLLVAAV